MESEFTKNASTIEKKAVSHPEWPSDGLPDPKVRTRAWILEHFWGPKKIPWSTMGFLGRPFGARLVKKR